MADDTPDRAPRVPWMRQHMTVGLAYRLLLEGRQELATLDARRAALSLRELQLRAQLRRLKHAPRAAPEEP